MTGASCGGVRDRLEPVVECIIIEIVLQSIIAPKSPILSYLCRLLCVMCLGGRLRVFRDKLPKRNKSGDLGSGSGLGNRLRRAADKSARQN
jgi:hypothetical protein